MPLQNAPQPPATPTNSFPAPQISSIYSPAGPHNPFVIPMQTVPNKDARKRSLGHASDAVASYRPVAYRTEGSFLSP